MAYFSVMLTQKQDNNDYQNKSKINGQDKLNKQTPFNYNLTSTLKTCQSVPLALVLKIYTVTNLN